MTQPHQRFFSLDVFRGMTVGFMIIVNSAGSGADSYSILSHANWNGFTPTDLVFPSFLFAVGNAMSFSMHKWAGLGHAAFLKKVFTRAFLIFLLGFLMYWYPFFESGEEGVHLIPFSQTRVMGVLQRIALCYLFAALMIRYLSQRQVAVLSVLFLVGYWVVLLLFGDPAAPLSMEGNAGQYLDKWVLGDSHLYHGEGIAFDPEGLLGTIPSIVNVLAGYAAGRFIQRTGKGYETIARLLLAGGVLILAALCWDMAFPVNKKLWTSSFVLLTVGIDLVLVGALVYVLELRKWNPWNWTKFFTIFGKNPLFIYLLSEILLITLHRVHLASGLSLHEWINAVFFQIVAPGSLGSLLYALNCMLLCWVVGWWLDRKKIYIRV